MYINLNKLPKRKRCAQPGGGFTLVEVIVAMLVLGVVVVTLYAGLSLCFKSLQSAQHCLRATQILTEKFEVIRLYQWSQITNGYVPATFSEYFHPTNSGLGNSGVLYTGNIAISGAAVATAYSNTMRRVVVSVNWTNDGIVQQQVMSSLISKYGIQTFTY